MADYEGLALHRHFYSPWYETEEKRKRSAPNLRSLLYWNSNIVWKDKQQLSFYISDLAGKYALVVQGIATNGSAGSAMAVFDVKK